VGQRSREEDGRVATWTGGAELVDFGVLCRYGSAVGGVVEGGKRGRPGDGEPCAARVRGRRGRGRVVWAGSGRDGTLAR
jgi:hypothetical protein